MKRSSLSYLSIVLLFAQTAFGQIPKTITYQGVLTDANNTSLPDANYNMSFRLYEAATGGQTIWTESRSVELADGVFSVVLGESNALNLAFDKPYWLGVSVNGESELTPRLAVTASAYSLTANEVRDGAITNAKIAGGQVVKSLNGIKDDVQITAGDNISILKNNNSLIISADTTGGGGGSSGWQISNNNLIATVSGNVGIGTSTPGYFTAADRIITLAAPTRAGFELLGDKNAANEAVGSFSFLNNSSGHSDKRIAAIDGRTDGSANGGRLAFYTRDDAGAWHAGFTQLSNGYVGIGHETAAEKLDVLGNSIFRDVDATLDGNSLNFLKFNYGDRKFRYAFAGGGYNMLTRGVADAIIVHADRINGTYAAPAALQQGDVIYSLNVSGRNAAGSHSGTEMLQASVYSDPVGEDMPIKYSFGNDAIQVEPDRVRVEKELHIVGGRDGNTGNYPTHFNFSEDGRNYIRGTTVIADNGGKLGIGTNNPQAKLDVSNDGAEQCCSNDPVTLSLAEATNTTGNRALLQFHNAGEAEAFIRLAGGGPENSGREGHRRFEIGDNQGHNTSIKIQGNLGTAGFDPDQGYPVGWGGGIHTYDIYSEATIAAGRGGDIKSYLNASGDGFFAGSLKVEGTATTKVLTITGGADLAEPFEMSDENLIAAGSVVVIDPENPGQLTLSNKAYDTCVAGIVSGAGGVNPGLTLQQEGVLENGQNVALSGRVYAKATAANGAIKPGDLLTTSDIPGHAMKATDRGLAHGTVIGKAMTALEAGEGLVLVLVNLQ